MMKTSITTHIKNIVVPSLFALALTSISACNTGKKIADNTIQKTKESTIQKPEVYLNHRLLYKTFAGRGDAQIKTEDKNQKISLRISMHKDQDILASAVAMGMLEVGRAFVTHDSVFAINRLNKTGYALGYQEGAALLKADIPFGSLQDLFAGNPLIAADAPVTGISIQDSMINITQQKDSFVQVSQYDIRTQVLKSLEIKATNRPFECNIQYGNYQKIGIGQTFAYDRHINIINDGKKINLDLKFTQAEVNRPVNTNFQIPPSYKVIKELKKD